jgi:hypothetical protein
VVMSARKQVFKSIELAAAKAFVGLQLARGC